MKAITGRWAGVAAMLSVVLVLGCTVQQNKTRWNEVQAIKKNLLEQCAANAIAQQKQGSVEPIDIAFAGPLKGRGDLNIVDWSAKQLTLKMMAAPKQQRNPAAEAVRIDLPEAMDMVTNHTGLAMTVEVMGETSREVRIGATLIGVDGQKQAVILPIVPVSSHWGSNPHEIYLDWAFINYRDVYDALEVLKQVKTIELTFGSAKRAPARGASSEAKPAAISVTAFRLVDYSDGSYDSSRYGWEDQDKPDLTLMHRTQEVTGIVAAYGGEAGIESAIKSLDLCVRTQCWDGSFLDGRRGANTVASGEYTFGFTLYGTLCGYEVLEAMKHPSLDEEMTVGPATMTRREFYQRMFYRGAMSRTAALPREYRDDIIGGDTLMAGANRVLGYTIAMRMIADALQDEQKREQVLVAYQPTMQQIADQQGAYSGGFPLLGEGNRFNGKGIHYDSGYIRTHMDWLVVGVRRTGDPLLVQMLDRYQEVFEAVMNKEGTGIKPLISERHARTSDTQLILPDATAQIGLEYHLPIIAQWGYNVGMPVWEKYTGGRANHFTFAAHASGYSLGAHTSILLDDTTAEPEPRDIGYLFPRQFPLWSSMFYTKDGEHVRTSTVTVYPDGRMENDFHIEVGEYLKTVGVPVLLEVDKPVKVEVLELKGWPTLLEDEARLRFLSDILGDRKVNEPLRAMLNLPSQIHVFGPLQQLPADAGGGTVMFEARLIITPLEGETLVKMTVINGTKPYEHVFINKSLDDEETQH